MQEAECKGMGRGEHGRSLYFPLNFAMNPKLFSKIKFTFKKERKQW